MVATDAKHLHIVYVSFFYWPPDFSGEVLLSIERLQALADRGHSVVVLTRRPPGSGRTEQAGSFTIKRCPVAGLGLVAQSVYLLWAAWALLWMPFDAMHLGPMPGFNGPTRAIAAWLFAGFAKIRRARTITVAALADSETEAWQVRGRTGLYKRVYHHNVDHIVAVSPGLFQPIARWRPDKAVLITNGVRDDLFTPLSSEERRTARKEFGIPEDGVVFITIGSAGRRKGYDLLAQAFAELGRKHQNWFLWLVGPMSRAEGCLADESEVAQLMAPLQQVAAQVRCFGRINDRSELRRLLGASDVFVFPTRKEGFGLAPVEAMAMGLPAVVSRIPGVTDVACVDQQTGLLVPVEDVPALVQAMERLGSNGMLRTALGNEARRRVGDGFSWSGHISIWERLYSQGTGNGASSTPGKSTARQ